MKLFIDSADINEIEKFSDTGFIDGVTTNPSLIAKSGQDIFEVISKICNLVKGPVSAEVTATDFKNIVKEGQKLSSIAANVCIKLPMTFDGLKACEFFSSKNIKTNVTLCFSASQALLAAKVGATFVSPFIGRIDDISSEGLILIEDIVDIYDNYPNLKTEVLAASIRSPLHVVQAAKIGCDVATVPGKIFDQMLKHPLTDNGLDQFLTDWKKTGQKIL